MDKTNDDAKEDNMIAGKKTLIDVLRARLLMRRSGTAYEHFMKDFSNGCNSRSGEHRVEVVEANRLMDYFKPITSCRRKPNETGGA